MPEDRGKSPPAEAPPDNAPPGTAPAGTAPSGVASGYLHGFTDHEQARLLKQARFLEASVYSRIDFSRHETIVEVGSGVGAQTEILLERYPHLKIQCIDSAPAQVAKARTRLARFMDEGRVRIDAGDALHLPYPDNSFDGAFVCWFLEHVQQPVEILREARRVLKPSGSIFCNEVLNATFYIHPYSPATLQYWFAFNDYQWTLQGDPFVGGKLANYLLAAGFQNVTSELISHHYDNRTPKRRSEFVEYWTELLLSGAPGLIAAGRVNQETVDAMTAELRRIRDEPDAVFFYSWVQAKAQAF